MAHLLSDFKAFLEASPTPWHAVDQLCTRLAIRDFSPLSETERWELEPGKKYFVERDGSLAAFIIPHAKPTKALILASHTDSPALKLKPEPLYRKENMHLFGTEVYGSPLLTSWLNRDLCLAGKVVFRNAQDQIEEKLIIIDDALLFIPQLAIHLDREVNDKGLVLDREKHLCPLLGLSSEEEEGALALESLIRRHIHFHTLLSFELFLVPVEPPRFVGAESEMITSYRLDNLASAHACATAMAYLEAPAQETLHMALFYNHEEVGSHSHEGAASPFLHDVLERISFALESDLEEHLALKHNALCISVDMVMLPLLARVLKPGGVWRVASDDPTYQGWVRSVMAARDFFDAPPPEETRPMGWPPTRYEAKALRAGRAPLYWTFVRR